MPLVPEDFTRPHTLIGTFLSITTVTRSKKIEVMGSQIYSENSICFKYIQAMIENVSKTERNKATLPVHCRLHARVCANYLHPRALRHHMGVYCKRIISH